MKRGLRLFLLRWHRRGGVAIALLVMMLVITGIPLNHSSQLALDSKPLRNRLLLSLYGMDVPSISGYAVGEQWLSHLGGNHIYLQNSEVAYCQQPIYGAVAVQGMIAVLCHQQLLLLTEAGEVVERVGSVFGLPDADGIAASDDRLLLRVATGAVVADLNALQFVAPQSVAGVDWVEASVPPAALQETLLQHHFGDAVTLERLLLDIHSGRIFGSWGVWLVDAAAVGLFMLALSGCWVWLTRPGRHRS